MRTGAVLLLLIASGGAAAQDSDDAPSYEVVERYLADLALDELRAEYLEQQLDTLGGSERVSVARRLADLYARLLRESADDAERVRLEQKASDLLASMPEVDADDLRLSLARASFERAERVLERWRVRAVDEPEATSALRSVRSLSDEFQRIGREAHRRIQTLESREERARDADLPMLERRIDEALERRSTAYYLAGWSHRYLAEFEGDRTSAFQSRVAFGWLLNAPENDEPQLDRVPEGYERLPHVALAMLCVSYTHARANRPGLADAWYARVASAETIGGGVGEQLTTRRLIALCAGGRYRDARELLGSVPADDPGAALLARLASVLASAELERQPTDRDARTLRDAGFASLVARGELAQAVEVVDAVGHSTETPHRVVGGLVRGVVEYQTLRDEHRGAGDPNEPASDPSLVSRYAAVADTLVTALGAADASAYPDARAGALFVLGLCRYYAGSFNEAAAHFAEAGDRGAGTPTEADALWMGIVALDRLGGRASERDAIIDTFLERFPAHTRASSLAMRRALERDDDPERSIEVLLSITPTEASYESAQRQAARLAYRQAISAPAHLLGARSRRFLTIAEPLLALDRRDAPDDPDAADRASTGARRILGVALRMDPPETSRAARAFDALDSMISSGLVDDGPFASELVFRRAEYALALGDVEGAEAQLDALQETDPDLAAQGDRLVWRDALRVWRRVRASGADSVVADAASRVVRIGERLIGAMGDPAEALADDANASVCRNAARAGADLWRTRRDETARARSASWYALLIEHAGASRDTLEGFVEMARSGGDNEGALDAQRRLVAGLESGSRAWYGARTLQLEILADVDTERARTALRQHVALHPDLAPEPWGARLRALARRLSVDTGSGP
ncbi:MAG: hypothetical protein AAGH64_01205 [Planctomycetota bacterium]